MKYLVTITLKPGVGMAEAGPMIPAEERVVWGLYTSGVVREMYFQPDPLRVNFVFEAASPAEIEGHLATLPLVQAGMLDHEITELGPWRLFEHLMDPAKLAG